jgi:putative membrane protein
MPIIATVLVAAVALLHVWFLVLERALWRQPIGMRTFRLTREQAETTATLAANQGLYNGFLAAGLGLSLVAPEPTQTAFRLFFLICVIVAGMFGALTVSRRILLVQALPAALALGAVLLAARMTA